MFKLKQWFERLARQWKTSRATRKMPEGPPTQQAEYVPLPEHYPVFPPPAPRNILRAPEEYWATITARRYAAPQGVFADSPTYALYRLYEFIVLDKVFDYRNVLEAFWRQPQWTVRDIPDPTDGDNPARYAFLAGCTFLLVRSFNQRVKLGLQRGMRSLITPEEAEALKAVPDHLRPYEHVPSWAVDVPPLATTLVIPTHDGEVLVDKDDKRADPDFLAKNILLWTPHIFFT
ncbi:DNA-binding protein [Niveomyces insectorum RCEF 264]|uniref:DNA-binding protein n=1 Tax=Niveomyces insectorum RCEF 264 TaxID=1081102 RepID=A0A167SRN6_9HYPO|nr:DNA-binding protein [Niveomyces insectorum RCEF 264]